MTVTQRSPGLKHAVNIDDLERYDFCIPVARLRMKAQPGELDGR